LKKIIVNMWTYDEMLYVTIKTI